MPLDQESVLVTLQALRCRDANVAELLEKSRNSLVAGNWDRALGYAEAARAASNQAQDRLSEAIASLHKWGIQALRARYADDQDQALFSEALGYARDADRLFWQLGEPLGRALAHYAHSITYQELGNYRRAFQDCFECKKLLERLRNEAVFRDRDQRYQLERFLFRVEGDFRRISDVLAEDAEFALGAFGELPGEAPAAAPEPVEPEGPAPDRAITGYIRRTVDFFTILESVAASVDLAGEPVRAAQEGIQPIEAFVTSVLIEGVEHRIYSLRPDDLEVHLHDNRRYAVARVKGPSMNRARPVPIEHEDYVLVELLDDPDHPLLQELRNKIVIVKKAAQDQIGAVKRLVLSEYGWVLRSETDSEDPEHAGEIPYEPGVTLIGGKVIAVLKPVRREEQNQQGE